jgi:hypothetical protein
VLLDVELLPKNVSERHCLRSLSPNASNRHST